VEGSAGIKQTQRTECERNKGISLYSSCSEEELKAGIFAEIQQQRYLLISGSHSLRRTANDLLIRCSS
jgi:hypothetical protein